jgi:hypothetical protein
MCEPRGVEPTSPLLGCHPYFLRLHLFKQQPHWLEISLQQLMLLHSGLRTYYHSC